MKVKNMKIIYALSLFTLLTMLVGCETTEGYLIDVTPVYTEVTAVNQRVTLSAKGWSDYVWDVENPEIGYLTSSHGESVTYVVTVIPEPPTKYETQKIIVRARNMPGATYSSNTSTNKTVQVEYTGVASVRHIGKDAEEEEKVEEGKEDEKVETPTVATKVISVTILDKKAIEISDIQRGDKVTIRVSVVAEPSGNDAEAVDWTMTGNTSQNTTITPLGTQCLLTIGTNETVPSVITVKATSKVDKSKYDDVRIAVMH